MAGVAVGNVAVAWDEEAASCTVQASFGSYSAVWGFVAAADAAGQPSSCSAGSFASDSSSSFAGTLNFDGMYFADCPYIVVGSLDNRAYRPYERWEAYLACGVASPSPVVDGNSAPLAAYTYFVRSSPYSNASEHNHLAVRMAGTADAVSAAGNPAPQYLGQDFVRRNGANPFALVSSSEND